MWGIWLFCKKKNTHLDDDWGVTAFHLGGVCFFVSVMTGFILFFVGDGNGGVRIDIMVWLLLLIRGMAGN